MSYGDMRLRPFAACALTAAALLTYGLTAQAQVRPGGIGGQSGSGGFGNSSTGNSSASFGSGGTAFNGVSAFGGANGPGGTAASEAEARQVGSLIRFAPGVRGVRNEMTWRAP